MRNLASPQDRPGRASSTASARSPPRSRRCPTQQASLYVNLDTTFKALAGVATPYLQDWIAQTPPTFQSVIDDGAGDRAVRD